MRIAHLLFTTAVALAISTPALADKKPEAAAPAMEKAESKAAFTDLGSISQQPSSDKLTTPPPGTGKTLTASVKGEADTSVETGEDVKMQARADTYGQSRSNRNSAIKAPDSDTSDIGDVKEQATSYGSTRSNTKGIASDVETGEQTGEAEVETGEAAGIEKPKPLKYRNDDHTIRAGVSE